jgi:hypothetical protein
MSFGNINNKNIFSSLETISKSLDLVTVRLGKLEENCQPGKDSSPKKEADTIKLLPGIIERITGAHDLDGVLNELLETFALTMDRGLILSLNEGKYLPLLSRGYNENPNDKPLTMDEPDDLLYSAVNSRQVLIFKGNISEQFSFASKEDTQSRFGMFIPIVFGDQVPLVYYGESAESPDPDFAEAAVNIASLVIKNQHLTAMLSPVSTDKSGDEEIIAGAETVDQDEESIKAESKEISSPEDPKAESILPEDSKKVFRSVDDFDTDVISAEELIRSFNIDINRAIPGLEIETEDFLESPEESEIADTDIPAASEDKETWSEPANLEVQLPVEESAEDESVQDYELSVEDEPAPEEIQEDGDDEVKWVDLEEVPFPEEKPDITDEPAPDTGEQISGIEEGSLPEEYEEAISFARLLVSEIKLYNEKNVEEGRRNGDLYDRLKEQIDVSKEAYDSRVSEQVRAEKDYFSEELLRILAKGNAKILNIG